MPKIISLLGTLVLVGVIYTMFIAPKITTEVNPSVNERSFDQLLAEMTETDVEDILGKPARVKGGEVYRMESAASGAARFAIGEMAKRRGLGILKLYTGANEETICVLFSPDSRTIVAAEYRICGRPVIYRGPTSASSVRTYGVTGVGRANRPDDYAEWSAAQLLRSQKLLASRKPFAELRKVAQEQEEEEKPRPATSPQDPSTPTPAEKEESASATAAGMQEPAPPVEPTPPPEPEPSFDPNEPFVVPRVKLDSGSVLSEVTIKLIDNWQSDFFPPGAPVVVAQFPNHTVNAILSLKLGRLNGPAVTLYEDGHLASVSTYETGELHGDFRLWDGDRHRVFFAQFARGKRDGVSCLFREGRPWLIQDWDKDEAQSQYLVVYKKKDMILVPEAKLNSEQSALFAQAQAKQEEVWAEIRKTHARLTTWLKQELSTLRKEYVAVLPPPGEEPAKKTTKPAASRTKFDAAAFENYWRSALSGCGF
jgi:hypothetical protein